jgi:hypothetical protein
VNLFVSFMFSVYKFLSELMRKCSVCIIFLLVVNNVVSSLISQCKIYRTVRHIYRRVDTPSLNQSTGNWCTGIKFFFYYYK